MDSIKLSKNRGAHCQIEAINVVIGGKWKVVIIDHLLQQDVLRFNTLYRQMRPITQKMLAQQLRELETDGIVERTVYPVVPPKVEYRLTALGKTLSPVVGSMRRWSAKHVIFPQEA